MWKRVCTLAAVLLLALSISAQAAQPRILKYDPILTFSGTTANCYVRVVNGNPSDSIRVVMTLWRGGLQEGSWAATGTGTASISKSYAAVRGVEYRLSVNVTINGKIQPEAYTSGSC